MRNSSVFFLALISIAITAVRADDIALTSESAAENEDGRIEVFGTGVDGTLYHRLQLTTGADAKWGVWEINARGKATNVRSARLADGRLIAAYIEDGALVIRNQTIKNGAWSVDSPHFGFNLRDVPSGRTRMVGFEMFALSNAAS